MPPTRRKPFADAPAPPQVELEPEDGEEPILEDQEDADEEEVLIGYDDPGDNVVDSLEIGGPFDA